MRRDRRGGRIADQCRRGSAPAETRFSSHSVKAGFIVFRTAQKTLNELDSGDQGHHAKARVEDDFGLAATDVLPEVKWGLPAATLAILATKLKFALVPQIQANHVILA
jgi:hypothetical protein